jgi:hypothetical protein
MINSNPETVSTDYDTSDLLFFEPLTLEDTLNVIERLNGRETKRRRDEETQWVASGCRGRFVGSLCSLVGRRL